jgi:hypothetical protein
MDRSKDLVEVIYRKSESDEIIGQILTHQKTAETFLREFQTDLRLDLHGVLDTIHSEKLLLPSDLRENVNICVISYVGKAGTIRDHAREETIKRIKTGQINFGFLVFNRGRRGEENKNTFHEVGSKAWINNLLGVKNQAHFIDDGFDHVESTKSMKIKNLNSILYRPNPKQSLPQLILECFKLEESKKSDFV